MRFKEKDSLLSVFRAGTYKVERIDSNGDWQTYVNTTNNGWDLQGSHSSILYTTCKKDASGFRPTQFCNHLVAQSSMKYAGARVYNNAAHTDRSTFRSCYAVTSRATLLAQPVIPDLASYHAAAMDFFESGCVDMEAQLPVSLLEIGEVKGLVPQFKNLLLQMKNNRGKTLRDVKRLAKNIAGGYLAVLFGILPLISDAKAIHRGLTQLDEHISWLRKNHGRPVRVSYRATIPYSGVANSSVGNYSASFEQRVLTQKALYHAFAIVTYDISSLTDTQLRLRALTRQFGFDDPVGTVWELIPFSFVIDWLFNVQGFLNTLTPKVTLKCRFKDIGYSVKIMQEWEHEWVHYPAYNGAKAPCGVVQHCARTFYMRRNGIPLSFGGIDFSVPSKSQLWTSLALLAQKL